METTNTISKEMNNEVKHVKTARTRYVITSYGVRVTMDEWLNMDPMERQKFLCLNQRGSLARASSFFFFCSQYLQTPIMEGVKKKI